MKTRMISALVAIPIFIWIILYSPRIVFYGFWFLTFALAGYEFAKLIPFKNKTNFWFFNSLNLISLFLAILLPISPIDIYYTGLISLAAFFLSAILWFFLIPILLYKYAKNQSISKINYYFVLIFWLILTWAMGAVIQVGEAKLRLEILMLLVCIWAADGGAYFIGKFFGKNKFSPKISPNKTWEGFWGGFLVSLISASLFAWLVFDKGRLQSNIFLALDTIINPEKIIFILAMIPTIIYASLGDLFESMLKRAAGVKDSGNVIPGHGGVFDRIDSWLSALIIFPFTYNLLVYMAVKIIISDIF